MPAEYAFVSVPKQSNNQGLANGKKNIIVVFDFDKTTTYTRDEKGVQVTALAFQQEYKPIGIFVDEGSTSSSITRVMTLLLLSLRQTISMPHWVSSMCRAILPSPARSTVLPVSH